MEIGAVVAVVLTAAVYLLATPPSRRGSQGHQPSRFQSEPQRPLAVVGLLVTVWAVFAGWSLVRGSLDLLAGKRALDAARAHAQVADLVEGRPVDDLRHAHARLGDAHRRLGAPVLAPVRVVPVVGRQVRSLSAMAGATATLAEAGATGVGQAAGIVKGGAITGAERAAAARQLAHVAAETLARVEDLDLGPSEGLVAPLAERRAELAGNVDGIRTGLQRGAAGGRAVATLLEGPRRYLVFAANNAEMRAGSGMFLEMGALQTSGGALHLEDVRSVAAVPVPPGSVPLEGDLRDRWGWLNPNNEWTQLMLSPRFDVQAPLAARMWAASGGAPVDGVLVVDPVSFAGLLRATGPVQVEGRTISADSVVQELLHDQYLRHTAGEQRQRKEELGDLVQATFRALDTGGWSVTDLAQGMQPVLAGRHVLAWSARPEEQADWSAAGVDGSLGPDSLLVAMSNRGANKLDYFQRVFGEVAVERAGDESLVTLQLRVRNTVPTGEPLSVSGDTEGTGAGEGGYLAILSVNVPGAASDVRIDGVDQLAVAGPDGPTQVVGLLFQIARNEERTFVVRFRLPGQQGALVVEPSARIPGIEWTAGGRTWTDSAPKVLSWGQSG